MFDINLIRDNINAVKEGLKAKKIDIDLNVILEKDAMRRKLIAEVDTFRQQQNKANDEISVLIKEKKDPQESISVMKNISKQISHLEPSLKKVEEELKDLLIGLPNLAHNSVPYGGEDHNRVVKEDCATPRNFTFNPESHITLVEDLDIIDFKRAVKITGSSFVLYKGLGARLERALCNFMLDLHTSDHDYKEMLPPIVVNADSMTGTGQLPKMAEDMYKIEGNPFYLIPTAEVPITNIHRDEVLKEDDLPLCYVALTPCFRREAGSYGKETKGLIRVHQFNKVELVKFVKPEESYEALESLLLNAEEVLKQLKLPYRVIELASGDLSFAAAKCYDIELHTPVSGWLEVSSCSNFEDFQARRSNIRYKNQLTKKTELVHTLNGSGVALARCMAAIIENYQTEDGCIDVPEVLQSYMGGLKTIDAV